MYHVTKLSDVTSYLEWSRQDSVSRNQPSMLIFQGVLMFAIFVNPSSLINPPGWSIFSDPTSTNTWSFGGVIGLYNAKLESKTADIGLFLWKFARGQEVSDKAAAVLLRWAMEGLKLERVKFAADKGNTASIGLAKRLGVEENGSAHAGEKNGELLFPFHGRPCPIPMYIPRPSGTHSAR
jgi:RimJ/RimL family protein N-acetyltransferase